MRISCLTLLIALIPCGAFAATTDFELDRGIGFAKGRDIESGVDAKSSRNSALDSTLNNQNQGNVAAAYGNLISIQTQPGSAVVLNANQVNTGNQTAEVSLRNGKQYRNVEVQPTEDPTNRLYYQQ